MDPLERYMDVKGGYARFVPTRVQVAVGPMIQRVAASASHLVRERYTPPKVLPDGSTRIYLFHIRKTAGTSLVRSFLALGGEEPSAVERRISKSLMSYTRSGDYIFTCGRGTLRQGDYYFGWSHIAGHRLQVPSGTFTIALFRDPVARVLSYYRYLLAGDSNQTDMAWRVQEDERALAGERFSDFLNNIPDELLLNQVYMFSPRFNVSEAEEKILECSAIMMTETYENDLRNLATMLGLELEHRRDRITASTSAAVDDDHMDALRERLAPEYELLEKLRASGRLNSQTDAESRTEEPASR